MIITSIPHSFVLAKNDAIKHIYNKFSVLKLKEISQSYRLDLDSCLVEKTINGWNFSSKLIDTPNEDIDTWLKIDRFFINPFLHNYKFNPKTKYLKYRLHDTIIEKELSFNTIGIELLAFYYREGYSVEESEGTGYYIIEPYSSKYYIDLFTCNCLNYLTKGKCLHLTLATSYHHNLRVIRNVKNTSGHENRELPN